MYENKLNTKKGSDYLVALDLGTSKILAMAGEKKDKEISILAMDQVPAEGCIRRGYIYKMEDTISAVQMVIKQLNRKLDSDVQKVYVGVGGQSLRMEYFSIKREINGLVTEETIQHLEKECQTLLSADSVSVEILKINLLEYYLDGEKEKNPRNIYCKEIEVKYQLLLGRPSLKTLVKRSIEGAGIKVADFIISPLATAEVILSSAEKENGCALVEIGAGVTYLSIYKNRQLKYLVTIPLGGNVVTKDISSGLHIIESEAEVLKINDGNAMIDFDVKEEQLLDIIVEARMNEIVTNVVEQIKKSGYLPFIDEGIILTGGGSLLKNTDNLFAQKTNYKKVYISTVKNPMEACIWGIAMFGENNCAKAIHEDMKITSIQEEIDKEEPHKNFSRPIHKILNKLTKSIFDYE